MKSETITQNLPRSMKSAWFRYALIILVFEKIIQHIYITAAFYFNWGKLSSRVVVNPRILMILGAVVAILFMISLWGLITQRKWVINLIMGLAVFDMIGELVAQGTIIIAMTFSFIFATALLILSLVYRRQEMKSAK